MYVTKVKWHVQNEISPKKYIIFLSISQRNSLNLIHPIHSIQYILFWYLFSYLPHKMGKKSLFPGCLPSNCTHILSPMPCPHAHYDQTIAIRLFTAILYTYKQFLFSFFFYNLVKTIVNKSILKWMLFTCGGCIKWI